MARSQQNKISSRRHRRSPRCGHEDVRVITRFNGEDCVKLSVLKEAEANTVAVARAVEQRISELKPAFPGSCGLSYVENQATYVSNPLTACETPPWWLQDCSSSSYICFSAASGRLS